jgi:hypothetical protein
MAKYKARERFATSGELKVFFHLFISIIIFVTEDYIFCIKSIGESSRSCNVAQSITTTFMVCHSIADSVSQQSANYLGLRLRTIALVGEFKWIGNVIDRIIVGQGGRVDVRS